MLGKNIKYLRTKKGYSLRNLASKSNTNHATIRAIENEKCNPTINIVDKISKEFNVTIDDLLHKDFTKE